MKCGADVLELLRKLDRQGCIWFLTVLGYPIFILVAIVLSLQTVYASYFFRIIIIILCLSELKSFGIFSALKSIPLSIRILTMAYLCRLTYDAIFLGFPPFLFNATFLIAVVMLPALAVGRYQIMYKLENWSEIFGYSGGVLCFGFLMIFFLGIAENQSTSLMVGRLSYISINPISIGNIGAITILAAFILYIKQSERNKITFFLIGFLGYLTLALSVSRGPALSIGLTLFFLTYLYFGLRKIHIGVFLLVLMCSSPFVVNHLKPNLFSGEALGTLRFSKNIPISPDEQQKFGNFIFNDSGSERIISQKEALKQFVQSPVFGFRSVLYTSDYPHNIFIEMLMALGIFGTILLSWILYRGFVAANTAIKNKIYLVPSLFFLSFFSFQFSGAIWNSSIFWVTLICLISVPSRLFNNR